LATLGRALALGNVRRWSKHLFLRVTVEYVTGELKVYVVDRAVLADLL
jgi:hypothetical protein